MKLEMSEVTEAIGIFLSTGMMGVALSIVLIAALG